jgi:hypothetical protein
MDWRASNPDRYKEAQRIRRRARAPQLNAKNAEAKRQHLIKTGGSLPNKGDVHHESGLIYWDFSGGRERWLTPEKFKDRNEKAAKSGRAWASNNRKRSNEIKKRHEQNAGPVSRLAKSIRSRITSAVRMGNFKKTGKTAELLGCDWPTFKAHLESNFSQGMDWSNYGVWHESEKRWNMDHVIPLASAETNEELMRLFHYTNTMPMWVKENLSKSDLLPCGSRARVRRKRKAPENAALSQ